MSISEESNSVPSIPPDSPGSSVSSRFQEEYDELMKYAVVVPNYNPTGLPHTLADVRDSFPQRRSERDETTITVTTQPPNDQDATDSDSTVTGSGVVEISKGHVSREHDQGRLPDFGPSPVRRDIFPELSEEEEEEEEGQEGWTGQHRQPTGQPTYPHKMYAHPRPMIVPRPSDSQQSETEDMKVLYSATIDPDIGKMENILDQWCLDLKRNVLAEFGQSKIRIVELGRQQLAKEKEKHVAAENRLQNEIENLKELLHTYEQSVERKDQVISNLTHALQKNKDKHEMSKKFNDWKLKYNDQRRETFASSLARKHYERNLSAKVWSAWHSVIEAKWRQRVEKACQARAQEVCMSLTNDYETKLASLNEALESAREEVSRLHTERDQYEETMKKAFMRGVCALNMEAMSMFHGAEEAGATGAEPQSRPEGYSDNFQSCVPQKEYGAPKTIPQEPVYRDVLQSDAPPPRVVTSLGSTSHSTSTRTTAVSQNRGGSTRTSSKSKTISTRISAKADKSTYRLGGAADGPTLAPPMSSVMVERHQPLAKQTIGKAAASRYPKADLVLGGPKSGIVHRKLAGQTGSISVTPNIQSVKVVD